MSEANNYPWCSHGINKTGYCADCKVTYLITAIESQQEKIDSIMSELSKSISQETADKQSALIESQKEEIESLKAENAELSSSEMAVKYQTEILVSEQLKVQLEAQKEETASWEKEVDYRDLEIMRQIKNGLGNRREAVKFEKQVESLKAITEIAVNRLKEIRQYSSEWNWAHINNRITDTILEIERLSHE